MILCANGLLRQNKDLKSLQNAIKAENNRYFCKEEKL